MVLSRFCKPLPVLVLLLGSALVFFWLVEPGHAAPLEQPDGQGDSPTPVWLSLPDCQPVGSGVYLCDQAPVLHFRADQPVDGSQVLEISGTLGNIPFSCPSRECDLELKQTPDSGADLFFGVVTSAADEGTPFHAVVRVSAQDPARPNVGPWLVSIVSVQLAIAPTDMCAVEWEAPPPLDNLPAWALSPVDAKGLETATTLDILAGKLIARGIVDARECPAGGLLLSGAANTCGIERARQAMLTIQNRFDEEIYASARRSQIPPILLKRLISQESQFWPGSLGIAGEYGLGQISELGADALLMWSSTYYEEICTATFGAAFCEQSYTKLSWEHRAMLRGVVMQRVNAQCPECAAGIDWDKASASVPVIAETLRANCRQVNQLVRNITGRPPGQVSTYSDLWRMTLANYNAGPGCLSYGIIQAWRQQRMDWGTVSAGMTEACIGAVDYVKKVAP